MNQGYQIRVQVILTADDDGTNGATINGNEIQNLINKTNTIYAAAGVQFVFDQASDLLQVNSTILNREFTVFDPPDAGDGLWSTEPRVDSSSHDEARDRLARLFSDKLAIYFRSRQELQEENGVWRVVAAGDGSSGVRASHVNMPAGGGGLNLLAHELGHFLQQYHTFVDGVETVAAAAARIKAYVEGGHPADEGLDALDGDHAWATDTPADARGSIFINEGLNPCGPVGQIPIPVSFNSFPAKTYILEPDRTNIMSYFLTCAGTKTLRFFADCAAKKWPCGQPAISFQQSAISLKSRTD